MSINAKLIQQLKDKNINLDLLSYSQKLSEQQEEKPFNGNERKQNTLPNETLNNQKQFKIRLCSNDQDWQLGLSQNIQSQQNTNNQQQFWNRMEEELQDLEAQDIDEAKLAEILGCNVQELKTKKHLKLQVNLEYNCLDQVSQLMPLLEELKLNNSLIPSLRDLGTGLNKLQILWICNCQLADTSSLSSCFPELRELYGAFNLIKELSGLIMHQKLEVLDLEGNLINEMNELQILSTVDQLKVVNLKGNPVGKDKAKRMEVEYMAKQVESWEWDEDEVEMEINQDDIEIDSLKEKFQKYLADEQIENVLQRTNEVFAKSVEKELPEEELISFSIRHQSKKVKNNQSQFNLVNETFSTTCTNNWLDHGQAMDVNSKFQMSRPQTAQTANPFRKTVGQFPTQFQSSKMQKNQMDGKKSVFQTIFSEQFNQHNGDILNAQSKLVDGTTEVYSGNPLKALRGKRKADFTSGQEVIFEEEVHNQKDIIVIQTPKDILQLLEEFGVQRDQIEDMNLLVNEENILEGIYTQDEIEKYCHQEEKGEKIAKKKVENQGKKVENQEEEKKMLIMSSNMRMQQYQKNQKREIINESKKIPEIRSHSKEAKEKARQLLSAQQILEMHKMKNIFQQKLEKKMNLDKALQQKIQIGNNEGMENAEQIASSQMKVIKLRKNFKINRKKDDQ